MDAELLQKLRDAKTLQELLEIYYDNDVDADHVIKFAYYLGERTGKKEKV